MVKGKYSDRGSRLANGKQHYPDVIWENVYKNPSREFNGKKYYQYGGWKFSQSDAYESIVRVRLWGHSARVVKSGDHYLIFIRRER